MRRGSPRASAASGRVADVLDDGGRAATERARRLCDKQPATSDARSGCLRKLCSATTEPGSAVKRPWTSSKWGSVHGRNLPFYPQGLRITGLDVSSAMLEPLTWRFGGGHRLRRPLEHVWVRGFVVVLRERHKAGMVERIAARRSGEAASDESRPLSGVGA
jgi:hypothetical protein